MKTGDQPHPSEITAIASSLDAWKGSGEPVRVHRKRKTTPGEYRTVLEFEIENRALQY